jgi:hypothetical protein
VLFQNEKIRQVVLFIHSFIAVFVVHEQGIIVFVALQKGYVKLVLVIIY